MRISDWSSDVCSSDLATVATVRVGQCRHVIALASDAVVVHQVDRAPRRKERQQEQDEGLERTEERMLAEQRDQGRSADAEQHEDQTLQARYVQVTTKTADDGSDAPDAALGGHGGDGALAASEAELPQRGGVT